MSIYSDCSQAISDLAELSEIFTEIDVVNHAASDGWSKPMYKEARKYANQIVSAKYRAGELYRYGIVEYENVQDYARRASMIVYGGESNGPENWETPNGSFRRIYRHNDPIQSSGRRKGTARHDERPWAEQSDLPAGIKIAAAPKGSTPRKRAKVDGATQEVERLTVALSQATSRVNELERQLAERDSLLTEQPKTDSVGVASPDLRSQVESIVLELIADVDGRLGAVEETTRRISSAFAS